MEESFTLSIPYRGSLISQDFVFRKLGYTYKIFTQIAAQVVVFEPDEEGSFRGALYEPFEKGEADTVQQINQVSADQAPYHAAGRAGARSAQAKPLDRSFIEAIIQVLTREFK